MNLELFKLRIYEKNHNSKGLLNALQLIYRYINISSRVIISNIIEEKLNRQWFCNYKFISADH